MQEKNARGGSMYGFLACTVSRFMTRNVLTITPQTTIQELAVLFGRHDFNAFPVVESGNLIGIVSKFDFLRAFAFTTGQVVPHYDELMNRSATEVMTEGVVHVDPVAPLTRVLQLMVNLKTRSFPVLNANNQLEGIISREDVMRALKETTLKS
jgi:CBS domain-containing protein